MSLLANWCTLCKSDLESQFHSLITCYFLMTERHEGGFQLEDGSPKGSRIPTFSLISSFWVTLFEERKEILWINLV